MKKKAFKQPGERGNASIRRIIFSYSEGQKTKEWQSSRFRKKKFSVQNSMSRENSLEK
jgi:hypothetical protein